MNKNGNLQNKAIGSQSAALIAGLYDQKKSLFTIEDAEQVSGMTKTALKTLLTRLVKKGVLTRVRAGLYNIVPFDHGSETFYLSEPALIAEGIVLAKGLSTNDYFISHGAALELHQMVTQPQLMITCSVTKRLPKENIHGTEIHFYQIKKEQLFGVKKFWINNEKSVQISDIERTIIDCLKSPQLCGGIIEAAKGLWIKKDEIDVQKIINYAFLLDSGVVIRRLGFLLDTLKIGTEQELDLLSKKLTKTYLLFDPTSIKEGKHLAKWRLQLNVTRDEILSAVRS